MKLLRTSSVRALLRLVGGLAVWAACVCWGMPWQGGPSVRHLTDRAGRTAFAASGGGQATPAQTQEKVPSELEKKLAQTGVFFRADTPRVMRNRDDPYLPVYLMIINGIEKAAHTSGSTLSQYLTREPVKLQGVNIYVKPAGARRQFAPDSLLLGGSMEFTFDARTNGQPLVIQDRFAKLLELPRETIDAYLNKHFIGGPFPVLDLKVSFQAVEWTSQDFYLRVRPDAPPLPHFANWYRGDVHYHSGFTDNPAERGYPLDVTKQAALHSGLEWMVLADHSTDLNPERFAQELREVQKLRDGRFMYVRGQELTLSSGKEAMLTTVHMVAIPSPADPDKGFPEAANPSNTVIMTGDGSVASPPTPVKDALARVAASGGFAYAAHPFDPISPLMRGGSWDIEADFLAPGGKQLAVGLVGLEPWNRATMLTADDARDPFCLHHDADPAACFQPDKDANQYVRLEKGIATGWLPLLQRGLQPREEAPNAPGFKVFLAAGSDAHGDFNYEATMDVVDFLGKPSRGLSGYAEDNAIGKISTVVFAPGGMGSRGENIIEALRQGHSVLSNGPLLIAGFDRNSNGSLDDPEDIGIGQDLSSPLNSIPPLQLAWVSSEEFGPLQSLLLTVGTASGESSSQQIPIPAGKGLASQGLVPFDLGPLLDKSTAGWSYVRLEARTRNGTGEEFRCYTNPIWVRVTGP